MLTVVLMMLGLWNEEMDGVGHLFLYMADEEGNMLSIGRDLHKFKNVPTCKRIKNKVGNWQLHIGSPRHPTKLNCLPSNYTTLIYIVETVEWWVVNILIQQL